MEQFMYRGGVLPQILTDMLQLSTGRRNDGPIDTNFDVPTNPFLDVDDSMSPNIGIELVATNALQISEELVGGLQVESEANVHVLSSGAVFGDIIFGDDDNMLTLDGLVDGLVDFGGGNDFGIGSAIADVMVGGAGDDNLSGGAGADMLFGDDGTVADIEGLLAGLGL